MYASEKCRMLSCCAAVMTAEARNSHRELKSGDVWRPDSTTIEQMTLAAARQCKRDDELKR
ncbi:hypothetical protein IG631_00551 [Alternaria alternata]|nr:hypothetical protein IG631_00551 [Alternaria alternata]